MIRDVVPFSSILEGTRSGRLKQAVQSFISFLERRFGAQFVVDARNIPYGRSDLVHILEIAEQLRAIGTIKSYSPLGAYCDEPRLALWRAQYRDGKVESFAAGSSLNDKDALTAAVAEALERHIWFERNDYFLDAFVGSESEALRRGPIVSPASFTSYTDAQRRDHKILHMDPESLYLWVRGRSHSRAQEVWMPAQAVSAASEVRERMHKKAEPRIRHLVTTGLATHVDEISALLSGALEIIERDAYMIMWLNQLTLPRLDPRSLAHTNATLEKLLADCDRYRLKPHFVRLITDVPAFAVCAVVEDLTGNAPKYTLGLRADRDLAAAAQKALCEALRARQRTRGSKHLKPIVDKSEVTHDMRLEYWAQDDAWKKLSFLIAGDVEKPRKEAWEQDDTKAHWERIVQWCKTTGYECASVSMTSSAANCTPWSVEMVVMPQLHPLYYSEAHPHLGGDRLVSVPKKFGYTPRSAPFIDEPHPFT